MENYKDNIYISHLDKLNEKIKLMKEGGKDKLHIVSDFDKTFTKAFRDGNKITSSVSLVRDGGYLTPDYPQKAYALFDKYHPYEVDETLSMELRKQKMQE